MAINDNMLTSLQSYMDPGFINRISNLLGQSPENVKTGVNNALPALLMGIVNKGSNIEGAQTLLRAIRQGGYDSRAPAEALREFEGDKATNAIQKGSDIVRGIFGNNADSIIERVSQASGLPSSGMSKIFATLAPLVMTVLGSRVKQGNLNATSLMGFLSNQKASLVRFAPPELFSAATSGRPVVGSEPSGVRYGERRGVSWMTIGLITLLLAGAYLLTRGPGDRMIAPTDVDETVQAQPRGLAELPTPMSEFDEFLASGNAGELPKRFQFEELNFEVAKTDLVPGSETELDRIAEILKQNPNVIVRIEGFTDSTGDPAANQALSLARANRVKEELVNRGVDGARIETAGRGAESPIVPNDTEENRARNRRIEVVVLQM